MRLRLAVPLLALSVYAPAALAVPLGFENITASNALDAAIGEAQLTVDVTDAGGGLVSFLFSNSGPAASSLTGVYFDDGTLLAIARLVDRDQNGGDAGVDFSVGARPRNLPGARFAAPVFQATQVFSADSDPPTQPNGVNPGETFEIVFSLQNGQTFGDTIAALGSGALRIGVHAQGFASGGSESFVNTAHAPEPSSALLYALAVTGVGAALRRQTRHRLLAR